MSVKIRMSRMGRRHRPFFRINVIDGRSPRDGKIIEKLGHYDPLEKTSEKEIVLDLERVKYWLDKGAIPSDAVSEILLRKGVKHKYAAERKTKRALARKRARAAGLPFLKSERKTEEKPAEGAEGAGLISSPQAAPAAEKPKEKPKEEKKEKPAEGAEGAGSTPSTSSPENDIRGQAGQASSPQAAPAAEKPKEKPREEKKEKPAEGAEGAGSTPSTSSGQANSPQVAPAAEKPKEKPKEEKKEKPEAKA